MNLLDERRSKHLLDLTWLPEAWRKPRLRQHIDGDMSLIPPPTRHDKLLTNRNRDIPSYSEEQRMRAGETLQQIRMDRLLKKYFNPYINKKDLETEREFQRKMR